MKKELSFFESLRYCIYNEKDIEFRFRKEFEDKLKTKITSFGNSDGVIKTDDLHTLIEIKYNLDLTKREKQCSVIMQGLYYLRQKFFDLKKEIPSSMFVSDEKNSFVLKTDCLDKYIKNNEINLIINTPSGKKTRKDILSIRAIAVRRNIPLVTTIPGAKATFLAIKKIKKSQINIKTIQEYHKEI